VFVPFANYNGLERMNAAKLTEELTITITIMGG
jgi:hypothetical protein